MITAGLIAYAGSPLWWPVAAVAVGSWAVCYLDRILAHRRLRELIHHDDPGRAHTGWLPPLWRRAAEERKQLRSGVAVVPYRTEKRQGRPKHHLVGAGRVWPENRIGINVVPATSNERTADGSSASEDVEEPASSVASAFRSIVGAAEGSQCPSSDGVQHFTPDELHSYVAAQLVESSGNTEAPQKFHPASSLEAFGIAAVAEDRWLRLSRQQWEALATLAQEGYGAEGAFRAPEIAERFLCVRKTAYDGELVACVFVSFAYEHGYLEVVVRPHVLNPLPADLRSATLETALSGWHRHRRTLLSSMADPLTLLVRSLRRTPLTVPETDTGGLTTSLREVYSTRHMEDMLQYGHARRYIDMMRERVLTSVRQFLADHNVDTGEYQMQVTNLINAGVIADGDVSNVQNQVGNVDAQQGASF